jgi:hypothetical protein
MSSALTAWLLHGMDIAQSQTFTAGSDRTVLG